MKTNEIAENEKRGREKRKRKGEKKGGGGKRIEALSIARHEISRLKYLSLVLKLIRIIDREI